MDKSTMESPTALYNVFDTNKVVKATAEGGNAETNIDLDPSNEVTLDLQELIDSNLCDLLAVNTPTTTNILSSDNDTNFELFPSLAQLETVDPQQVESLLTVEDQTVSMPQYIEVELSSADVTTTEEKVYPVETKVADDSNFGIEDTGYISSTSSTTSATQVTSTVSAAGGVFSKPRKVGRPRIHDEEHYRTKASRRKMPERGSHEYTEKRERNNVAVRKSRDKAKVRQLETETRCSELTEENQDLQRKVDLLQKELNVLKGLFANVGAALPKEFTAYLAAQAQKAGN